MNNDLKIVYEEAKRVAENNKCCKYSSFTVGAILITQDDKLYSGCNIENHGLQSICAERVAFSKALSEGEYNFKSIFVIGKNIGDEFYQKTLPCGYCRQFMSEYANPDFKIITYDEEKNEIFEYKLKDLLPESFEF